MTFLEWTYLCFTFQRTIPISPNPTAIKSHSYSNILFVQKAESFYIFEAQFQTAFETVVLHVLSLKLLIPKKPQTL